MPLLVFSIHVIIHSETMTLKITLKIQSTNVELEISQCVFSVFLNEGKQFQCDYQCGFGFLFRYFSV